jgi:hypothetical protein
MEMVSFLDNENQMLVDSIISDISETLFEQWNSANLDEGLLYADWRIASISNDSYIASRFNSHWELVPEDEYYLDEN